MLDTREGYEVAERDAETPALKTIFGQMIALRTKDHEAIRRALTQAGEKPDKGGSFMATVHKTMTSARSAVTGVDANALGPFISAEGSILEKCDAAIEESSNNEATRDLLLERKEALSAKVAEMKSVKDAA